MILNFEVQVANYSTQKAGEQGAAPDRFYVAAVLRSENSCNPLRLSRVVGGR